MAARKRHDPTSRPADGRRAVDKLIGADPTRHYVYVNPNDPYPEETGIPAYEALGYEIEHARKDGPRPAVGKTVSEGGQVTARGQVLMSCPIELKRERDDEGGAIATGWERRILRDGNVEDGFRGRGRGQIAVDGSETSEPTTVWGA